MKKEIINHVFHTATVRTLEIGGEIMFIAKDVAESLGYKRPSDAIKQHCKRPQPLTGLTYGEMKTLGLHPSLLLIPEPDVYRLVLNSHLPSAKAFEEWVMDEVLPSVNKTGAYVQGQPESKTGTQLEMLRHQLAQMQAMCRQMAQGRP